MAVRVDMVVEMMLNAVVDIIVDFCRIWLNFLDCGGETFIIYGKSNQLRFNGSRWRYCA